MDITDAAVVVAIGPDGFEPGDATVSVGDVVKFTAADDGIYSVIVSDLDGYTVATGLDEYFRFDEPGSYPVAEELSGATDRHGRVGGSRPGATTRSDLISAPDRLR